MRVLNGAQTTLCYLGVLAGYEHTSDGMSDPLLVHFVRRMLLEETLPTLEPVPGVSAERYVEQSLDRLRNAAIRHRNHQIATDGSQKIVQRLLMPILDALAARGGRGAAFRTGRGMDGLPDPRIRAVRPLLDADDPYADRIAGIADRVGHDTAALAGEITAIDTIFDPELAASGVFRRAVIAGLDGLLLPRSACLCRAHRRYA